MSLRWRAALFPILLTIAVIAVADALLWSVSVTAGFEGRLILLSTIAVVVAAIASFWYAGRLVRPIRDLMPHVDGEGHLEFHSTEHHTKPPKELEALTVAIDQIGEKQRRDLDARIRLERVRSEFLGNVSHELRTPIFAVQGFIETLLDGAIDDPKVNRDFLERARTQADRLNNLLNDLIDISRIESGEMRMNFRMIDVQPFLRDLVNEMQPQARAKEIDLYFTGNILPHHEVSAYADKERIRQVMVNLVDNAIKYSEGKSAIKIELLEQKPTAKQVTIRVSDTGIGIAPEHLSRLFERFYRVNKDRARSSPGGTGLGLAIVKHIIEAHRGTISVESELKKGSTFTFTLGKEPF
jgi:two-component system phosphate regulon sensor histidine kinase PhoR